MGVTRRQAHRLSRQFADHGVAGLRHRSRGRPSNRWLGPHVRERGPSFTSLSNKASSWRPVANSLGTY
jgi:hypothetical protein